MRYLMRQKLFCFGDDFTIKDDGGREVYQVDGKVFSLGNKLAFNDMEGNELAFISQKLLSWGPTYEIYSGGQLAATVSKQHFTFLNCKYTITAGGVDLEAEGNFSDHSYIISRDGRPVAEISKRWFTMSDTYGVEIAGGENDLLLLASTVVIDMICHPDQKEN